jgi:hypothetical protein
MRLCFIFICACVGQHGCVQFQLSYVRCLHHLVLYILPASASSFACQSVSELHLSVHQMATALHHNDNLFSSSLLGLLLCPDFLSLLRCVWQTIMVWMSRTFYPFISTVV